MRTCEFPKSSKPTNIHNSSLLAKKIVRDLKTDAFLLTHRRRKFGEIGGGAKEYNQVLHFR